MATMLDKIGDQHPVLRRAVDTHVRVREVNGQAAASAVTMTVFVSLFPLIVAVVAIIGFVASDDPTIAQDLVNELSLGENAAETLTSAVNTAEESRRTASVIGLGGLIWAGLGVAAAIAMAVRRPWQLKPSGLRDRGLGVVWILGATVLIAGAFGLGSLLNFLPDAVPKPVTTVGVIIAGLLVELGFFLWTFWILGDRRVGLRDLLPGAVLGAVGFEILKLVGTVYVPNLVERSSSLYGPIGVVFAILAWLVIFARLLVYAASLNAVSYEASHGSVRLPIDAPRLPSDDRIRVTRGGTVVGADDDAPLASTRRPVAAAPRR